MSNQSLEAYIAQYKDILNKEQAYQFFIKAQFALPKIAKKKSDGLFYGFTNFILIHLAKFNEAECAINLLDIAFKEYIKIHPIIENDKHIEFITQFMIFYKTIKLLKGRKTFFKVTFLQYCEKCKVIESLLKDNQVYLEFSEDCIKNEELSIGYRFALKSENYNSLIGAINAIKDYIKEQNEIEYFITRTILELCILKNVSLAQMVLLNYYPNLTSQLDSCPPVINFGWLLLSFLLNEKKNYDDYSKLTKYYQNIIDKEKTFKGYLNMISKVYFDKKLNSNANGGFSFMNILRSLTGGD